MKGKNPLGAVKWSQKRQQKDWLKRVYLLLIIENRVPKKPLFLWTPCTSFVAIAKLIYASTCLLEQQQPSCRFKSYLRRAQSFPPPPLLCLLCPPPLLCLLCCFCLKLTRAICFFFSLFSILRFTTISFLEGRGGKGKSVFANRVLRWWTRTIENWLPFRYQYWRGSWNYHWATCRFYCVTT